MDLAWIPYVLFPKEGQWVKLAGWGYSHIRIFEVDWEKKKFRAFFLIPPKHEDIPQLNYPEVNEEEWIPFERIETTLRKFWEATTIEFLEEALRKKMKHEA